MTKLAFCLLALLLAACNNEADVASASDNDSTEASTASLPYSVPVTPDWEKGSRENIAVAMTALKSYEMNDSSQMVASFADSVDFFYDGGEFKGPRDSLWKMMTEHRATFTNVSIKMHDYESVKSKVRGEEWVSLWYTETATDRTGKTDSSMTMDDLRVVNGKIRVIDTKLRRLAAKKM